MQLRNNQLYIYRHRLMAQPHSPPPKESDPYYAGADAVAPPAPPLNTTHVGLPKLPPPAPFPPPPSPNVPPATHTAVDAVLAASSSALGEDGLDIGDDFFQAWKSVAALPVSGKLGDDVKVQRRDITSAASAESALKKPEEGGGDGGGALHIGVRFKPSRAIPLADLLANIPEEVRSVASGAVAFAAMGTQRFPDAVHDFEGSGEDEADDESKNGDAAAGNKGQMTLDVLHYELAEAKFNDLTAIPITGSVMVDPFATEGLHCGVAGVTLQVRVGAKEMEVATDKHGVFRFTAVPNQKIFVNATYNDHTFCALTPEGYCIKGRTTFSMVAQEGVHLQFYDTTTRRLRIRLTGGGCEKDKYKYEGYVIKMKSKAQCRHTVHLLDGHDGEFPSALEYVATIVDAPKIPDSVPEPEGFRCTPPASSSIVGYFQNSGRASYEVNLKDPEKPTTDNAEGAEALEQHAEEEALDTAQELDAGDALPYDYDIEFKFHPRMCVKVEGLDLIHNEESICVTGNGDKSMVPESSVFTGKRKIKVITAEDHYFKGPTMQYMCYNVPGIMEIVDNISPADAPCSDDPVRTTLFALLGCRLTSETRTLKGMYFQLVETKCFQPRVNLMSTCTALPLCGAPVVSGAGASDEHPETRRASRDVGVQVDT